LGKSVFTLCGLVILAAFTTWSYLDLRSIYWFVATLVSFLALGVQSNTVLRAKKSSHRGRVRKWPALKVTSQYAAPSARGGSSNLTSGTLLNARPR
jgi:hypothetical protein